MSEINMHSSPTWEWVWDEEYETNIKACPEGYTYVRGFKDREGKTRPGYCRKLGPHERSRTVEKVRRKMQYNRDFQRSVEESETLSEEEWNKKYGHLRKRRKR